MEFEEREDIILLLKLENFVVKSRFVIDRCFSAGRLC